MAIKAKQSRMGSMMGVDLNSVSRHVETPAVEEKVEAKEPVKQTTSPSTIAKSNNGFGKPKFELIAGAEEKKINFHFPEVLYDEICHVARKQKKSAKQFISEILLEEMTTKYGFHV